MHNNTVRFYPKDVLVQDFRVWTRIHVTHLEKKFIYFVIDIRKLPLVTQTIFLCLNILEGVFHSLNLIPMPLHDLHRQTRPSARKSAFSASGTTKS